MKSLALATGLLVTTLPNFAQAATVYGNCAAPSITPTHRTFYVDPVNGSPKNDGSAAKPWRTLAEVLNSVSKMVNTKGHDRTFKNGVGPLVDIAPKGPIRPGDVIMLKTGNHGKVTISNTFNNQFITVMAAPGQKPVIQQLYFVSSAKWMFQGIKFMADPAAKPIAGLVSIGMSDWLGSTTDIVLDGNTLSATDNTAGWTDKDWTTKPYINGVYVAGGGAKCIAVTNNHFYNLINGVSIAGPNSVVQGNLIEKISNDGIDIAASNLLIKQNTIKNGVNSVSMNGLHADGIQGMSAIKNGKPVVNENVVVDGNSIVKTGDPKKSYMQGISIFDGRWSNLIVQNNVVVTNHWNGIVLSGVNGGLVVNNTVLAADPNGLPTRLSVGASKDGTTPKKSTIRNNIVTVLNAAAADVNMDHNYVEKDIDLSANGVFRHIKTGTFGDANTVVPTIRSSFLATSATGGIFDLRLKSGSPAIGVGTATLAPRLDIQNKARANPITLGAYAN